MTISEKTAKLEKLTLCSIATFSAESKGRVIFEEDCALRTCFQRDRDRITHSKSFRRLKHKTQVFLSPEGDHYRTRLTHTLEVSQIARTIARALRLNEDLTEAVALGHDLGHTPFGHAGERALAALNPAGFKHYEQSVRVVERLEKDGRGLNLTHEVRNGILCHTSGTEADTPEGRIIRWADKIAYLNHDIDDAVRAGVIAQSDIPKSITEVIGNTKTERITSFILSVVNNSLDGNITMDKNCLKAYYALSDFLFSSVYLNDYAKFEERKVPHIIECLFEHFKNPDYLPNHLKLIAEKEGKETASCDYVSGMTDHYAVECFSDLYIPKSWNS